MRVFALLAIGLNLSLAEFKDDDIRNILTRLTAAEAQNNDLSTRLTSAETRLAAAEAENEEIKHTAARLPMIYSCGSRSEVFVGSSQQIPYTNLMLEESNMDAWNQSGAGLNIATGTFTAGHPGIYTVTYSTRAHNDAGENYIVIFLRKNGEWIYESKHFSWYTGPSGQVHDQGGRTLHLHLNPRDTLDLWCDSCSAGIADTTFCISLSQFDVQFNRVESFKKP